MPQPEVPQHIVRRWRIWGPNSDGGEDICFAGGALWFCRYGDGPEHYTRIRIADYLRESPRQHAGKAAVVRWLKDNGHVPQAEE